MALSDIYISVLSVHYMSATSAFFLLHTR